MIESLRMIGLWNFSRSGYKTPRELVIKGRIEDLDKFITSRVQGVKNRQIIVLILDPANQTLRVVPREVSREELIRLSFIGHRKANIPQDVLTVLSISYLTGKVDIRNGKVKEKSPSILTLIRNLRDRLQRIDEEVFKAIWEDEAINGVKFGEIIEMLGKAFEDKRFRDWLRREVSTNETVTGCKKNCVYTLAIKLESGEVVELATTRPYKRYLLATEIYPIISPRINIVNGYCYVCNERRMVLTEPIFPQASLLKIYTLDKISFVQGLARDPKGKMRNFSICPECNFLIVDGLRYVENEYTVRKVVVARHRGGGKEGDKRDNNLYVNMYIVPAVSNKKVGVDLLGINEELKTLFTWEDWNYLQKFLNKVRVKLSRIAGSMYYIHLIFGGTKANSSDFTYVGSVQDVPVFDMIRLAQIVSEVKRESGFKATDALLRNFPVGTLKNILRVDPKEEEVSVRDFLYLMRVLMVREPFNDHFLYIWAGKTAKALRFRLNWSKTKNAEKIFIDTILKYLFLLKIIYKILGKNNMGSMSSSNASQASPTDQVLEETLKLLEDGELAKFIKFLGLDRAKAALFLLGVLVAEIGCEQAKKGDNRKAVLNKLKYPGMDRYDVVDLANYIPFGLRHYRIFGDYETLYSAAKRLLDMGIEDLGTPEENLFYILSGYAYQTYRLNSGGGCGEVEG